MKKSWYILFILAGILIPSFIIFNFIYLKSSAKTKQKELNQIDSILKQKNQVICTIKSEKSVYHIGEKPSIKVCIQNNTDSVIALTGSLDGSAVKARMPFCYFEITRNGYKYNP